MDWGSRFPVPGWSGSRPAAAFRRAGPVDYPGPRVPSSFLLRRGVVHALRPTAPGTWAGDDGRRVVLGERHLVLAYGSNLDPEKLAARLAGDVVVLRCLVLDHAAVWCDARRQQGDVVATLAAVPGRVELHGVLALTDGQLTTVDGWEGTPVRYARVELADAVVLEDGSRLARCWAYVGTPERRPPLRRGGRVLPVAEHAYAEVDALVPPPPGGVRGPGAHLR